MREVTYYIVVDLSADKELLKTLYKSCKSYPERERYHALLLVASGRTIREVAGLFFVDEDTIAQWIKKWLKERNVSNRKKEGRPREVDGRLEEAIVKLVEENNPRKYGVSCSSWDCEELRKFFLLHGVAISRETIRRVLKQNGFRYVKADYDYVQADESKKKQFLRELSQIIEDKESGSSLLFYDEMGTLLHPKKGYRWIKENKKVVKTFCSHKKVSCLAAVNPLTGNKELMLTSGRVDEKAFLKFLKRVYGKFKGTLFFFLDRFRPHLSGKVSRWLELHPKINFVFLPPYSPELNPIEWLWNFSRKKFLNNLVFRSTRQLMASFSWFIRKIPKSAIKRICNINILLNRIT